MKPSELQKLLKMSLEGDYLTITYEDGAKYSGRYNTWASGGVHLYTSKRGWRVHFSKDIKEIERLDVSVLEGLSEEIRETVEEERMTEERYDEEWTERAGDDEED